MGEIRRGSQMRIRSMLGILPNSLSHSHLLSLLHVVLIPTVSVALGHGLDAAVDFNAI
jgi:hypothetical protein